jgi:hypothetical protein
MFLYAGKAGSGTTTRSPGSNAARKLSTNAPDAPTVTTIRSGSTVRS